MPTTTVRLEYGNMRFENDVASDAVADTIARMAERHGIDIKESRSHGIVVARGRVTLTNQRAVFKVL